VGSNTKRAAARAAMLLVQPVVLAMPAMVPITAYSASAVLRLRKPVGGRDAGSQALFAALTVAESVTVEKSAVQTAVCLPMRGIRVVGRNIAQRGNSAALDRPDVALMNGHAVEIRVCGMPS
jgi:hypothetical protein